MHQADLIPAADVESVVAAAEGELARRTGDYTMERALRLRPAHCEVARRLLLAGIGIRATAAAVGLGVHTVSAIRDEIAARGPAGREDDLRAALSDESRRAAVLCAERVSEILSHPSPDVPVRDLATAAERLASLAELLSGRATSRIETIGPTPDDVRDELARMSAAVDVVVTPPRAGARGEPCTTCTSCTSETGQGARTAAPQLTDGQEDRTA
jgi:hypothetical protein